MNNEELLQLAKSNGCKNAEDIIKFHFQYNRAKDKLFLWAKEKYNLANKAVCDIGSGYGHYLVHFGPGSYGLELSKNHIDFADALGVKSYQRDFIEDDLSDLPKVDVVWTSATIEHVDSPHIFLRKMYNLLNDDGILFFECPVRPVSTVYKNIPGLSALYDEHGDHVNFFTPDILKWNFNRTGFDVQDSFRWSIPLTNKLNLNNPTVTRYFPMSLFTDGFFAICRKNGQWNYPNRSIRTKADNSRGYVFKDDVL